MTLLLACLGSCVTPGFKMPEQSTLPLEGLYRGYGADDSTCMARMSWHEYYADPRLQALIGEALDSNLNLRINIKRMEEARAYWRKSRMGFVPTLAASAQAQFASPSDNGTSAVGPNVSKPIQDYSLGVSASWEIDIWGKIRSAKREAYANLLSQEATKNAVVTQLVADMAGSYYRLLMLDEQLRITEKTIDNYTEYLETVKALKMSAQANEVAVQQAYAQLYGAQSYIPELMASIEATETYIGFLLGKPGFKVERADSLDISMIGCDLSVGLPAQLLQYRPDVMAAEQSLRASHYRFNVAKASMYPSLTIGGSVGVESVKIKEWFDPESLFWNAVGGLVAPIINARALRTQKEVAKLQNEESLLAFKAAILNAGMEVSNAVAQCRSTARQVEIQSKQTEALAKSYEYSQMLLVRGYATYIDVLVAQTGLFNSQIALNTTSYNAIAQRIELYRALGGGWTTEK
ncbi:MAG: TolC family protein [Rikenellaceae bacterium]|nr:TolC family protein [Rikenellaceae bacterium]